MSESLRPVEYLRERAARVCAVGLSVLALHGAIEGGATPDRVYAATCTTEQTAPNATTETCIEDDDSTTITGESETVFTGSSSDKGKTENTPPAAENNSGNDAPHRPDRPARPHRHEQQSNPNIHRNGTLHYNYNQGDNPWGPKAFRPGTRSGQTYKSSACGQTATAMVVSNLLDRRITPLTIGRQFPGKKAANGSLHSLPMVVGRKYGLRTRAVGTNMAQVKKALTDEEGLAVALVGPGEFTPNGHFITLAWDENKKEYRVSDPNARNRAQEKRTYTGSELLHRGNVRKLWTFTSR